MIKIIKERGKGKTTEAIIMCQLNGWTLVTRDAQYAENLCTRMGMNRSLSIMSYSTFNAYCRDYPDPAQKLNVVIDDIIDYVKYTTNAHICGYTDTINDN
jgi:hypothetical protein